MIGADNKLGSDRDKLSFILSIDEVASNEYGRFGGKTVNLGRLSRAGFYVPMGFTISSECFTRFLEDMPQFRNKIDELESTAGIEEMLRLVAELEELGTQYRMPSDVGEEISLAIRRLQARTGSNGLFAVRSSANVEDSRRTSFAGQARSFLGLGGLEGVIEAVKKTWQSLYSLGSVMYLRSRGIPLDSARMAVIVQEMINAEISGVMFTTDPANDNLDQMMVESTWGLGEPLVSGKVIPDTYFVEKNPLKVIERKLGSKEMMCLLESSASLCQIGLHNTPTEKRAVFTLDDESVLRTAGIGLEIERVLGGPQDIEWCIRDDQLVILQARPISAGATQPGN